ncbi:MAG TPA: DinB family protein [Vicinamibacteria bacterium]|nr:DinB family protein [Vicinamibacteria bacterium]
MRYRFLVETYETEILKVLSVWSMFEDSDLSARPSSTDERGRSVLEHMVHQSMSENLWFRDMLGIGVTDNPLPARETRVGFIETYSENASKRLAALRDKPDSWWEEEVRFFEVIRSRAWIVTRRIAHTAHHRGQQTALLRMLGRDLHSTYGPTADTGGLMQNQASVVYAYRDLDTLLDEEKGGTRRKASLPGPGEASPTERPGS